MSVTTTTTGRAAACDRHKKEAVMGQAVPRQHPAVVLRSHYTQLRILLAIAMIAVIGLTVAVVVLAGNDGAGTTARAGDNLSNTANPGLRAPSYPRWHGSAPVPDMRVTSPPNGRRFDGGPDEGTRGIVAAQPPNTRTDGGPDEGSRGPGR
jgi:hypothetical protein